MSVFINAAQAISPQHTFLNPQIPSEIIQYDGIMRNILPDFRSYFKPNMMRRMSRVMRFSTAAAQECLKEAGMPKIDSIITGTGLGCLEDTEKFLNGMLDNNESQLSPTPFIQSTHNTLGGIIALSQQCNEYNITYAHKTISFESAMLDAMMQLKEGKKNILVGGIDEITVENYNLRKNINSWKNEPFSNMEICCSDTPGCKAGEGAAYFMISSEKTKNTYAEIQFLDLYYKSNSMEELSEKLMQNLERFAGMAIDDIDLVLFGINGDHESDAFYHTLKDKLFNKQDHAYYKHFCGEYDTSASFGLWMATRIIKQKSAPDNIIIGKRKKKSINNVLLYNQEKNKNHSFILLSAC